MMEKLFGTDGIRGKAGSFPISPQVCYSAGYSFGKFLKEKRVLIGSDTRESSGWIAELIKKGLKESGAFILDAGVVPTPVLAFSVNHGNFDGGIVITASHNPFYDNGIKFFNEFGKKLKIEQELLLEKMIYENIGDENQSKISLIPTALTNEKLVTIYVDNLEKQINFKNINKYINLDCANGAASYFIKIVKNNYKLEIPVQNVNPNGKNINLKCGAAAYDYIETNTCALDGDGDRIIIKDEFGNLINGDILLMFLAETTEVKGIVGTVMTNQAVENFCNKKGIDFFRTDVGDRNIREKMDETGIILGGETSGHIILDSLNSTGDGFAVYLKVVENLNKLNLSLNDLVKKYPLYPQKLINITVKEKLQFSKLPGFDEMCNKVEKVLKEENGRIFPRYSGTENYLRILLESETKKVLNKAEQIVLEYIGILEEK